MESTTSRVPGMLIFGSRNQMIGGINDDGTEKTYAALNDEGTDPAVNDLLVELMMLELKRICEGVWDWNGFVGVNIRSNDCWI